MSRLVSPILECLADALGPSLVAPGPAAGADLPQVGAAALVPGSTVAREAEKAAALVGALLATGGDATCFDVSALFYSLRDLFAAAPFEGEERGALVRFAEWLNAVACDSFAAARTQAERERWREQLEDGTPVVLMAPELPVAFLVGRPDGVLLDSVLSRLLLLIVRVGARAAVLDAGGLADPARPEVLDALSRFLSHRKVRGAVALIAVGMRAEPEKAWHELAQEIGTELSFDAHLDRALERALSIAGYRLVKS